MASKTLLISLFTLINITSSHRLMVSESLGSEEECTKAEFVPGHNLAGEGIDVLKMENKKAYVINMEEFLHPNKTCILKKNNFLNGKEQKLPLSMVDWRTMQKCSHSLTSSAYSSSEALAKETASSIKNDWKLGLSVETPKVGGSIQLAGRHSNINQYFSDKSKKDKMTFIIQKIFCEYYSYRLVSDPPLEKHFLDEIEKLPEMYEKSAYQSVIDTYGTHYTTAVNLGGKVDTITSVKTCEVSMKGLSIEDVENCLNVEASATVVSKVNVSSSLSHCKALKTSQNRSDSFSKEFSDRKTYVYGGHTGTEDILFSKTDSGASVYKAWLESTKLTPAVVTFSLKPLHGLIRNNKKKKENLQKALSEYFTEAALSASCTRTCKEDSKPSKSDSCSCECSGNKNLNNMCCPTQRGLGNLTVFNLHAKNLYGDQTTQADAYVEVSYRKKVKKTERIDNNDNPEWNETFKFGYVKLSMDSEITVKVFDDDMNYRVDVLGECNITISSGTHEEECKLHYGQVYFSYTLECAPSLGGPTCKEYAPSPIQSDLAKRQLSRSSVPNKWSSSAVKRGKMGESKLA
ncbi:perforin-1-like [Erpetoichthys calabaricus]|uniref:perforin-1-like n=1 Tax=Erpetoichthys calabaricus TaxID=27687 RepID=UPI0010A0AA61|nr:perforin-1-like [Erpetoichthys calabaricus]